MRVLLSTIGSRGEVQPVLALASELRALGQDVRLCVPPDFRDWLDELGFDVVPIGPELRATGSSHHGKPTPEQIRKSTEDTVTTQFETISVAAEGCDVLVAGGALQFATRSIAQRSGAAYVYASFCPITLPSDLHAPPPMPWRSPGEKENRALWAEDAQRWNSFFGGKVNEFRAAAGQAPVDDLPGHVFGDRPWLAADAALAPWPEPGDPRIVQTGAWIWPDERPLPDELREFLDAGEPPVYFGFGSMRAPGAVAEAALAAARAHGRQAVVARGWADLVAADAPDCLGVGEVNQQALFKRVAAVVHHGGAGTTTAAARAGAPQVVVPQMYDQHYFAGRIRSLGLGAATDPGVPTVSSLTSALEVALRPEVASRAKAFSGRVRGDGASVAARHLLTTVPLASA
ncbi:vancomycin aglycone glucosyltransferase [Amycolatopsis pretoriensis]|uniref:Vancomycin aglycone glucosyltransferase n=1 Tax=Amycolatopsis pretoriensis TaxID=218821 RepID=A0A1H5QIS8_9PSEU|nr:glycosyltransferase [Amycolatopsis pretoriensis]SEF25107.1 vancomycin aglycone glucosyltransferase [Amycolatopsis pretoriensis]